jgi:hypothetical protein
VGAATARGHGRRAQILLDGLDRLPNVELVESRW